MNGWMNEGWSQTYGLGFQTGPRVYGTLSVRPGFKLQFFLKNVTVIIGWKESDWQKWKVIDVRNIFQDYFGNMKITMRHGSALRACQFLSGVPESSALWASQNFLVQLVKKKIPILLGDDFLNFPGLPVWIFQPTYFFLVLPQKNLFLYKISDFWKTRKYF